MHVRDYARFTQLFKWGAVVCLSSASSSCLILKLGRLSP